MTEPDIGQGTVILGVARHLGAPLLFPPWLRPMLSDLMAQI